jgi:hypothetical protein
MHKGFSSAWTPPKEDLDGEQIRELKTVGQHMFERPSLSDSDAPLQVPP